LKLSKTSLLILAIGIFVIAFASLGTVRSQKIHEQNQLGEELSLTGLRLSKLQLEELYSQQKGLEERLSQTLSQFEAAKAILSQPIRSIAASQSLFDTAKACGVEITGISSSGLTTDDLEGIICAVLPLAVKVEGDVSGLLNFITELNDNLATGTIKSAQISVSDTDGEEGVSADIRLVIYTYQGD